MSRYKSDPLSPTEWKVMKIVWRLKSCASRDVYTEVGEKYGWAPNTVRTILSRLVEKKFLKIQQIGNCYVYRPVRSFHKSLFGAADDLLDKLLGGNAGPLLAYLMKNSQLSKEDIEDLREMLDQHEENLSEKEE